MPSAVCAHELEVSMGIEFAPVFFRIGQPELLCINRKGQGGGGPTGAHHRDPLVVPVRKAALEIRLQSGGAAFDMPRFRQHSE